jgi:tetrahydromethanopterin S-methyltransferase subunit E
VFLEIWRTVLFEQVSAGWGAIVVGILMILIFTVADRYIEVWARKNYGPYTEIKEASS